MKRPPALDDFLKPRLGNGPALSGEEAIRAESEAYRAHEAPPECAARSHDGPSPFDEDGTEDDEDFFGCAPNFKISGTLTFKD